MERTYQVSGMSCSHCVGAVKDEVSNLVGVNDVDVDLSGGRVVVRGDDVDDEAVRSAIADAGYEVTS
jgi:copper chaperone